MAEENAEGRRFRLVALDIDGTLLDPRGQLTARTRNTVRAAELVGVTVALATSRRWTPAAPIAAQLWPSDAAYPLDVESDGDTPTRPTATHVLILCDGAMIRRYPDGKVLHMALLPSTLAQAAALTLTAQGLPVMAQYADTADASRESIVACADPIHPEWTATYLEAYRHQTTFAPIEALCAGRPYALRLMAFGPVERLRAVAEALAPLGCGAQITDAGMYGVGELTVFSAAASKGAALVWLAEWLGAPLAETMAIGDGVNDVSMLRVAGLGVAMGGAIPEALAAADVVTAPNSADGVAEALDRYILTPEWAAEPRLVGRPSVRQP